MVHFAKRVRSIESSPTVHIGDLIAEMKARGEKVLSLAIGEPDFPTPAHIVDAAKKALDADFTKYTPAPGIRGLRVFAGRDEGPGRPRGGSRPDPRERRDL